MEPTALWEIEQIKQLKARYFRLMDLKRWDEWAELFTADCVMQLGNVDPITLRGRDEIVQNARRSLAGRTTAHRGYMPEIRLVADQRATGIWGVASVGVPAPGEVDPAPPLQTFGHYADTYVKDGPRWLARSMHLTTLLRVTSDAAAIVHLTGGSEGAVVPTL